MSKSINAEQIAAIQTNSIPVWQADGISFLAKDFLNLVEENHSYNYQLWKEEDKARRDDLGPAFVRDAKRLIDGFNQKRNNWIEKMDDWLMEHLSPANPSHCPVHSETPGMIIDRLSILALKIYFMALQTKRLEATPEHRQNCEQKLAILQLQQQRLIASLYEFLVEIELKTRTFCIYRQFKMYNDPSTNPELYAPSK